MLKEVADIFKLRQRQDACAYRDFSTGIIIPVRLSL
jgi:hypothetical protein